MIGFDDVPMASWPAYDLTTVRQPLERMVDEAVNHLLLRMEDPGIRPAQIRLECELRVRGPARLPAKRESGRK